MQQLSRRHAAASFELEPKGKVCQDKCCYQLYGLCKLKTKRCLAKGTQMSHRSLESISQHDGIPSPWHGHGTKPMWLSTVYSFLHLYIQGPVSLISHRWHLSTIAYEDHIHHHVDPRCVSVHHHLCRQQNRWVIVIQTLIDKHYALRRLWLSSMNSQKTNNNT